MKYSLSNHAVDTVRLRWGVARGEEMNWANETLRKSTYIQTQKVGGKTQKIYDYEDMRFVVGNSNVIITIKPLANASFLAPILEREKRKLKREITRITRTLEMEQAKALTELAANAINKARARNPKTRELIQTKIGEINTQIDRYSIKIKAEQDRLINFEKVANIFKPAR